MIISASRRTDIPAFYSKWFMNRIRAGYCTVPNPFNRRQVSFVSLRPEDVEVIVFWTRNPRPLMPHLGELEQYGYRYYFQFTVMDNPRPIDTNTPPCSLSLRAFRDLSDLVGPKRVIWRYDPIVFTKTTDDQFHISAYRHIAEALCGYTYRSVISVMDLYRKTSKRLLELRKQGVTVLDYGDKPIQHLANLMHTLVQIASENGMEIVSCAEELDLGRFGIRPGKCIDDGYIKEVFGIQVTGRKDPGQREACGCVVSKDIGMYDTCLFGCQYCYATSSFEKAKTNYAQHNPDSPSLTGWYNSEPKVRPHQARLFSEDLQDAS